MVGQADDRACLQGMDGRVVYGLAGLFLENPEYFRQQVPERVRLSPPGQRLCDGIHERHATIGICRDDGVANACQCDAEPFRLLP